MLHVGLDAGGTTTRLLARAPGARDDLALQGLGANPSRVGMEEAAQRLGALLREALRRRPEARLAAVCAGVAGAGSEAHRQALETYLAELLDAEAPEHLHVVHDAAIALEAAFGEGSGVVVIAGTGPVVFARSRAGAVRRAGGWGYLLGDEGSGFALGRAGLQAVAHALDGGPPTHLRALFAGRHELAAREAILHRLYQTDWPLQDAAALVLGGAAAGDAIARRLLDEQTTALARQAAWLAQQGAATEPRIALFGGLTGHETYVRALRRALRQKLPDWPAAPASKAPVEGALHLALRLAPA